MSLYAVQDNVGNYWDFDNRGFHSHQNNARRNTTFNLALADAIVQMNGGHVVELAEKSAPIVVSEAEAKILEGAKKDKHPCMYINWKVQVDDEARLMRAYVIGLVVEKPKRYVLPMPTGDPKETSDSVFVAVHTAIGWHQSEYKYGLTLGMLPESGIHTQADIDAAPKWVQVLERVEVTDHD